MANVVYEPYIEEFTNQNTLVITHGFGRGVNPVIEITSDESGILYDQVDVEINTIDDNSFSFSFYESGSLVTKSGRVIVS